MTAAESETNERATLPSGHPPQRQADPRHLELLTLPFVITVSVLLAPIMHGGYKVTFIHLSFIMMAMGIFWDEGWHAAIHDPRSWVAKPLVRALGPIIAVATCLAVVAFPSTSTASMLAVQWWQIPISLIGLELYLLGKHSQAHHPHLWVAKPLVLAGGIVMYLTSAILPMLIK